MKTVALFNIKFIFFCIFFSFSRSVQASGELVSTDARSFALGNLHALSREALNPAYLSFHTKKQLSASALNRFEMKELNTVYLQGKYPNRFLDTGFTFSHYGYEDYRIIQTQAGLAKKILPELSIGINLTYYRKSSFWEENAQNRLASDIGIYYRINPKFELAFLADNVLHTFPEECWNIYGGMSYKVSEACSLLAETTCGAIHPFDFSLGIEYEPAEELKVRAGTQVLLKAPSFGVAYLWNKWTIDAGFSLHPVLGTSSIIGLNYCF
ncbi:MAG: hypothetical protein LBI65_01530 [Candidatus Symbiothrix sp.]|jgi:hypothetical protein|nr:hypothetical protein [Candidatus Symbiothrix sp.]